MSEVIFKSESQFNYLFTLKKCTYLSLQISIRWIIMWLCEVQH